MVASHQTHVTEPFRAIADGTRRQILDLLSERDHTIGELVQPLGISQPSVSQQVKRLVDAGIVEQRKRGRERICSIRPEALRDVFDWVVHYRRFWSERLDQLGGLLDELGAEGISEERPEDEGRAT